MTKAIKTIGRTHGLIILGNIARDGLSDSMLSKGSSVAFNDCIVFSIVLKRVAYTDSCINWLVNFMEDSEEYLYCCKIILLTLGVPFWVLYSGPKYAFLLTIYCSTMKYTIYGLGKDCCIVQRVTKGIGRNCIVIISVTVKVRVLQQSGDAGLH